MNQREGWIRGFWGTIYFFCRCVLYQLQVPPFRGICPFWGTMVSDNSQKCRLVSQWTLHGNLAWIGWGPSAGSSGRHTVYVKGQWFFLLFSLYSYYIFLFSLTPSKTYLCRMVHIWRHAIADIFLSKPEGLKHQVWKKQTENFGPSNVLYKGNLHFNYGIKKEIKT